MVNFLMSCIDDPAALFVPVRPIELDDASAQCFSSARKWLADCSANHPDCETNSQPPLPTRVIDVSESDDVLKLHQSGPEDKGAYAALSYCWGSEQPEQTTTANLNRYLAGFRCSDLAQSLQDAISITRQLGIQYLWVDSMCIVQDDKDDVTRRSSRCAPSTRTPR
jgi:hypothetical protein